MRAEPRAQDLVAPVEINPQHYTPNLLASVHGPYSRQRPPRALFIAPITPNDRGNGLAMRTGFLLDAYAQRFAVDLAVVPVAGGTKNLTPFVAQRVRRAIILEVATPGHPLHPDQRHSRPKGAACGIRAVRPPLHHRKAQRRHRTRAARLSPATIPMRSRMSRGSISRVSPIRGLMRAVDQPPCLVLDCDEDDVSAYRRFARLYRRRGCDRQADWAEAEAEAFRQLAGTWLPRFDLLLAASSSEARLLGTRAKCRHQGRS